MRLQDQRHAFHGGGVGTFAAFGQALVDEFLRRSESSDALAGVALAAKIVWQSFAVGRLREHAR